MHPQVAATSGAGIRFGHPSLETLERLQLAGIQVWRTDERGDVEIVTDGERLWVTTGRQGQHDMAILGKSTQKTPCAKRSGDEPARCRAGWACTA